VRQPTGIEAGFPEGIAMTTGTALPMDRSMLLDAAQELERTFGKRMEKLDGLSRHEMARLSAIIIRTCLAHDASSHVVYE
jgi:hypothetical protein